MKSGLLWFDPSKETEVHLKAEQAFARYREKYGTLANLMYIHPDDYTVLVKEMSAKLVRLSPPYTDSTRHQENFEENLKAGRVVWMGMHIQPKSTIMRNHMWLGRRDEETKNKEPHAETL